MILLTAGGFHTLVTCNDFTFLSTTEASNLEYKLMQAHRRCCKTSCGEGRGVQNCLVNWFLLAAFKSTSPNPQNGKTIFIWKKMTPWSARTTFLEPAVSCGEGFPVPWATRGLLSLRQNVGWGVGSPGLRSLGPLNLSKTLAPRRTGMLGSQSSPECPAHPSHPQCS